MKVTLLKVGMLRANFFGDRRNRDDSLFLTVISGKFFGGYCVFSIYVSIPARNATMNEILIDLFSHSFRRDRK